MLLQGLTVRTGQRAWHMFQPASAISQPASVTHALLALSPAGAIQGGVAVRQAPEPGPVRGDRVELYDLFFDAPSPSLRGTEGEVSATPIERVANCGFLVELLTGGSSGRPCPVR
jgi:hypothetical protein